MTQLDGENLAVAWGAVYDAVPTGWTVRYATHHVEAPERPWHVYATELRQRLKRRESVEDSLARRPVNQRRRSGAILDLGRSGRRDLGDCRAKLVGLLLVCSAPKRLGAALAAA